MVLGEALGMRGGRLRELALAGILHHIGKLSVPHAILAKPGRLTDEEMDVIRPYRAGESFPPLNARRARSARSVALPRASAVLFGPEGR